MVDQLQPVFLWRSRDERVLTGVAGGIGERLGVDPWVVRIGFLLLTFAGGVGVLLYLTIYFLTQNVAAADPSQIRPRLQRHAIGLLLICVGSLFIVDQFTRVIPTEFVFPLVVVAIGAAIIWSRSEVNDRELARRNPLQILTAGRYGTLRVIVGLLLFLVGVAFVVLGSPAISLSFATAMGFAQLSAGALMLIVPLVSFTWHGYMKAQRERTQSDIRAELSAHLHDSVLNTLAFMQRIESVDEIKSLARRQERELRAWMQGKAGDEHAWVDDALRHAATRIENEYHVKIGVVTVGAHIPLTEPTQAIVAAMTEAMVNAARHAGVSTVAAYLELIDGELVGSVRDEGSGFVEGQVEEGRQGLRESIRGRMERVGGSASITSEINAGTEVECIVHVGDVR